MDRNYIGTLYQFYKDLLNDKQAQAIELYYFEDFSLTEIAEHTETTKQAVSNLIIRSENLLLEYEEKLKLFQIALDLRELIDEMIKRDMDKDIVERLERLLESI